MRVYGLWLCAALALAAPARGQQRIAVLSEPGTAVVAAEFLVTTGPADEEANLAGITYLSARSVTAKILPALDSIGAHLNINAQKDAISFSLVGAPDTWERATTLLLRALFRDPPDSLSVRRERQAIVAELRGRASNPADAAILDMDQAFFGAQHPWGRSTVGTPQTIERITLRNVDDFLRDNFLPSRTMVAVAGPVEEAQVRAHLTPLLGSGPQAPVEMTPFRSAERPVTRDYNSITTWVSASFRFPETGDEEALRFVSYLATDQLSFSAFQRSVFNVWSEVVPRVGAGEIRLQVVVPPEEAEAWARRLTEVVPALAAAPMLEDVFASHLRRYNGERLMDLLSPEDRAHAAVRQLLVNGRFTSLIPDLEGMTQERMRAAARSLSRPTVVLLGPTLSN